MRIQRRFGLAALCVAALVTAGCGTTVTKDNLAEEISKQMDGQLDRKPESVKCPDDLKGEVGQTMTCKFEEDGETLNVKVTVTKVEGSAVLFDIEPDAPTKISPDELADAASSQIEKDVDFTPDSVTCPDEIERKEDETTKCEYTANGGTFPITVTVTKVDGAEFGVSVVEIPTVPAADLAQQVVNTLVEQLGAPPESIVTCPGPLEGVVGTEMRCEVDDGVDVTGVNVTVTSVEGTQVLFDIKVVP